MKRADVLLQNLDRAMQSDVEALCEDLDQLLTRGYDYPDWDVCPVGAERFTMWLDKQSMPTP